LSRPIEKPRLVRQLADSAPAKIGDCKIKEVNTLDGVKYILEDDSWLLIRPSGTEPVLRIYAEAANPDQVQTLLDFGGSLAE